jgi:hypothetical protein
MDAWMDRWMNRWMDRWIDRANYTASTQAIVPSREPVAQNFCTPSQKSVKIPWIECLGERLPVMTSIAKWRLPLNPKPLTPNFCRANPACDQYREMEAAAKKARQWTRHTDGATGLVFYVDSVSGAKEWSIPRDVVAVRDAMRRRLDQVQDVDGRDKRGPGDKEARHGVRRGLSFPSAFAASITFGGGGGARRDTEVPPSLGSLLDSLRCLERGEVGEREEREAVRECKALAKQLMRR